MTAKDLARYFNKEGNWQVNPTVKVAVKITDARIMFGRIDVLVTPLNGEGEAWVDSQFVAVDK